MQKKAFVVTYFGELPFWFHAFQLSCKYNPEITWIIFTDSQKPKDCSGNIVFINLSLDKFSELASIKLGVEIKLSKKFLYKICDFKPAFGLIYEDYLRQFDFWGHCDIDIIWGKINNFIDDEIVEKHDVITSRRKRISGHFCLYRNTDEINRLFLSIPHSTKLLQYFDKYQKIDEELFSIYLNLLINPNLFSGIKFFLTNAKIPRVYWDRVLTTSGKHQRALISNSNRYFKWSNGKVYDSEGDELMYIHFHILKKLSSFNVCSISDDNSFFVSPFGINEKFLNNFL